MQLRGFVQDPAQEGRCTYVANVKETRNYLAENASLYQLQAKGNSRALAVGMLMLNGLDPNESDAAAQVVSIASLPKSNGESAFDRLVGTLFSDMTIRIFGPPVRPMVTEWNELAVPTDNLVEAWKRENGPIHTMQQRGRKRPLSESSRGNQKTAHSRRKDLKRHSKKCSPKDNAQAENEIIEVDDDEEEVAEDDGDESVEDEEHFQGDGDSSGDEVGQPNERPSGRGAHYRLRSRSVSNANPRSPGKHDGFQFKAEASFEHAKGAERYGSNLFVQFLEPAT